MKTKLFIISFLTLLLIPFSAFASDDDQSVKMNLNGNNFYLGSEVVAEDVVMDTLYLGAAKASINTYVSQDAYIIATDATIMEKIGDDLFLMAGNADLENEILGDAYIMAVSMNLKEDATIKGDLYVIGEDVKIYSYIDGSSKIIGKKVILSGRFNDDVYLECRECVIGTDAVFEKNLSYKGPEYIEGLKAVKGEVKYLGLFEEDVASSFNKLEFWSGLVAWGVTSKLLVCLVLLFLFPTLFIRLGKKTKKDLFKNVGIGFISILLVLISVSVLMFTIIGIPLAFFLLFAYILFGISVHYIIPIMMLSLWEDKYLKTKWHKLAIVALHIVIILIIKAIPVIGVVVMVILWLAATGALLMNINKARK